MVERIYFLVKMPSSGAMTGVATDLEIRAMRLNCRPVLKESQQNQYQE